MQYYLTIILYISTAISIFTNTLLIYLIVRRSPRSLGSYKHLMIFMSVIEILYSLILLLLKPELRTKGYYWISETDSTKSLVPLPVSYFLLLIYGGTFGVALAGFGVHFIFQYLTAIGSKKWVTGIKPLCLWLGVPVLSGAVYMCSLHICSQSDANMEAFVREQIGKADHLPFSEIVFFGFSLATNDDESGHSEWHRMIGGCVLAVIIIITFFVITYFGAKTYFVIKRLSRSNKNHLKHLQSQLFYSLALQSIIPIILINIPSTMIVIKLASASVNEVDGYILNATCFLFPAVDPLPKLIIIKPYRNAIAEMLRNPFRRAHDCSIRTPESQLFVTRKSGHWSK